MQWLGTCKLLVEVIFEREHQRSSSQRPNKKAMINGFFILIYFGGNYLYLTNGYIGDCGGVNFLKREIPLESKLPGCLCSSLFTW
jgi:hypothetical protein